MKRFASYIIGVAMTLTLFDSADAELAFRSNSKVLLPNPTSVAITPKPSATIYQPTSKNSINTTSKGIQLHFREYPLGEILKNQGYATALIGKWHLGMHPNYRPARHGFDYHYGFYNGGCKY